MSETIILGLRVLRPMHRSAVIIFTLSLCVVGASSVQGVGGVQYVICDTLTRCAGAGTMTASGCARGEIEFPLAGKKEMEVCATVTGAAAGALALNLPIGVVSGTAMVTDVDHVVLDRHVCWDKGLIESTVLPGWIACTAAAAVADPCVKATAHGQAANNLGPLDAASEGAEVNDCDTADHAQEAACSLVRLAGADCTPGNLFTKTDLRDLPPDLRRGVLEAAADDAYAQAMSMTILGEHAQGSVLRETMATSIRDHILALEEGGVRIVPRP